MTKRKRKATFPELVRIMARLRAPGGCPWDREQTHASLLRYLREESEEVADAVRKGDMDNLQEELGDVLLQILFHSQIASERRRWDISDVLTTLRDKLIRRHPHVFGKGPKENLTPEEVKRRWTIIKAGEQKRWNAIKRKEKKK